MGFYVRFERVSLSFFPASLSLVCYYVTSAVNLSLLLLLLPERGRERERRPTYNLGRTSVTDQVETREKKGRA